MPHTTRLYVLALISACLLVVFVTRHGWPSVHQGKHIIETTSRELQQVVIPVELNLTLAEYLESKNVNHGTPIFTTIITENYSPAVDTFISTIRSFGMGHTVLVVCVFEGCTRYFAHTGHANLLVYDGFYRQEQAVFQSTTGTVDQRQLARFGLLPRIKFDREFSPVRELFWCKTLITLKFWSNYQKQDIRMCSLKGIVIFESQL